MSLKMKVGSYYYNTLLGVLQCTSKADDEQFVVKNKHYIYAVNEQGCSLYNKSERNLEYECDEYGNEIYATPQTTPTKNSLELKIDTSDAILSIKKLRSEIEKLKGVMYAELESVPNQPIPDKQAKRKHNHYFKDVSNLNEIDVYAVLTLFEVHDPCIAHAAKKLLCTGNRGHKDFETDVQDAIDSLVRWKELNRCLNK